MGIIISRFRKEKSTYQILERLEEKIKDIDAYTVSTQAQQKRYVGNFLVFSFGLYFIGFLIFFFAFFPPTWPERITYSTPLLIFPLLIFLLKRLVTWYFEKKLHRNSDKLSSLREEKRKILQDVMDKETYKVALEILKRFNENPNGVKSPPILSPIATKQSLSSPINLPAIENITPQQTPFSQRPAYVRTSQSSNVSHRNPVTPTTTATIRTPYIRSQQQAATPNVANWRNPAFEMGSSRSTSSQYSVQRRRTPYPVIDQNQKGVMEKMVDYLIGDGPNNRFAMICKECYAHNGMALQEEYEYSPFRCAFCNAFNAARKLRPQAPKLSTFTAGSSNSEAENLKESATSSSASSESEPESAESDNKVPEKLNIATETPADTISAEIEEITENVRDPNVAIETEGDKQEFSQEEVINPLESKSEVEKKDD